MAFFPNAISPLVTPTYDGSGQTVHPSVIDFLAEYNMASWRGYRYWMAHTPYPGGNDAYENPSLLASHDGQTWVTPAGISNPLTAGRPGFDGGGGAYEEPGGWNADSDLCYDPVENVLRLYWMSCQLDAEGLSYFACTESGNSSTFAIVPIGGGGMSPTIVREDATHWHKWDVPGGVRYQSSSDGVNWVGSANCTFPQSVSVWHVEVKRNPHNGRLEMLLNDGFDLFHFESSFSSPTSWGLVFAGQPTKAVERAAGWNSNRIYRSSLSFSVTDSLLRRVWYSALGTLGWRVGYTEASVPALPDEHGLTFALYSADEPVAGTGAVTLTGRGAVANITPTAGVGTLALTGAGALTATASLEVAGVGELELSGAGEIANITPMAGVGNVALTGRGAMLAVGANTDSYALTFGLYSADEPIAGTGRINVAGAGNVMVLNPLAGTGRVALSGRGLVSGLTSPFAHISILASRTRATLEVTDERTRL